METPKRDLALIKLGSKTLEQISADSFGGCEALNNLAHPDYGPKLPV